MSLEWHKQLREAIETTEQLETYIDLSALEKQEIEHTMGENAFRITPYYA